MPRARCTVIDRRKRQKPPGLRTIVGSPGQTAQLRRIKIPAQGYRSRHDEPPWFATLNLTRPHRAIAQESRFQGLGITCAKCRLPYTMANIHKRVLRVALINMWGLDQHGALSNMEEITNFAVRGGIDNGEGKPDGGGAPADHAQCRGAGVRRRFPL